MQNNSLICILFICFFSHGLICLAASEHSILFKMFQVVIEDMQSQDKRIKVLENNNAQRTDEGNNTYTNQECKCQNRDIITQQQLNNIQGNIQQIMDYLVQLGKGFAAEKLLRAENTNAIESFSDQYKESFKKLHQTIDLHKNTLDNFIKDTETDFKELGDQINFHTEKVIHNITREYKAELDENERENEDEKKKTADLVESNQRDIEQIKHFLTTLNSNLALDKNASESSTYNSEYNQGPTAATDGKTSANWEDSSCTHTEYEENPWWQVDLGRWYVINRVVISNQGDCCGERLQNLVISVNKEYGGTEEICGHFKGPSRNGATETIKCNHTVLGRYLKIEIQSNTKDFHTLCEVEIYST